MVYAKNLVVTGLSSVTGETIKNPKLDGSDQILQQLL